MNIFALLDAYSVSASSPDDPAVGDESMGVSCDVDGVSAEEEASDDVGKQTRLSAGKC